MDPKNPTPGIPESLVREVASLAQAAQAPLMLNRSRHVVGGEVVTTWKQRAARHKLGSVESLITWTKRRTRPEVATVLVGTDAVVCTRREEDPEPARVELPLTAHPRLKAWQEAIGKRLLQKGMVQLLNDRRKDGLQAVDASFNAVPGVTNLSMLRDKLLRAKGESNATYQAEMSTTGGTRLVAAGSSSAINVEVPDEITIYVPVFACWPDYCATITLTITVDVSANGIPTFELRWPEQEVVLLEARQALAYHLQGALQHYLVVVGDHQVSAPFAPEDTHQEWSDHATFWLPPPPLFEDSGDGPEAAVES